MTETVTKNPNPGKSGSAPPPRRRGRSRTDRAASASEQDGKAPKADPKATPAKDEKPKAEKATPVKANAKRQLALKVVEAVSEIPGLTDEDKMTISRWIHHIPADHAAWVEFLPAPDRSDWK